MFLCLIPFAPNPAVRASSLNCPTGNGSPGNDGPPEAQISIDVQARLWYKGRMVERADQERTLDEKLVHSGWFSVIPEPKRKSAFVAEQLIDAIAAGIYAEGSSLPSEREIASLMGVSRNSVREALGALAIVGIVHSKAGDATYVSSSGTRDVLEGIQGLFHADVDLLDIWRAKEELETLILTRVMCRVQACDVEELEVIIARMTAAVGDQDFNKFCLSNADFHSTIAHIAASTAMEKVEGFLLGVTQHIYRAVWEETNICHQHLVRSLPVHEDILATIREKDEAGVCSVMEKHFSEILEFLSSQFAKSALLTTKQR
ncbi:FadR/GntR family transcriptional regulator [Candidatus Bipolaricaulota bacterium]